MANPGLSTTIDTEQLTAIIVFANSYRKLVSDNAAQIKALCTAMKEDESLSGGDGELIRNGFSKMGDACANIEKSTIKITKVLNEKLEAAINMRQGKTVGDSGDKAERAAKNAGVLKKE